MTGFGCYADKPSGPVMVSLDQLNNNWLGSGKLKPGNKSELWVLLFDFLLCPWVRVGIKK